MTRLVGRLGARAHHILLMQEWGRAIDHKPELMIPPARLAEVMRACKAVGDEIGVTIDNDASLRVRIKGKHGRKTDLCSCGWDTLAVFSDGQVYPCVWLAGAPGMECGSIREQPLEGIWRTSPVLESIRRVSVQNRELCSDCHLKFLCAGGSPCSSHFASLATRGRSDVHAAEPYCETFMGLTHDMLWELGLAGVPRNGDDGGYAPPCLFNAMDGAGAHCARPNTLATGPSTSAPITASASSRATWPKGRRSSRHPPAGCRLRPIRTGRPPVSMRSAIRASNCCCRWRRWSARSNRGRC